MTSPTTEARGAMSDLTKEAVALPFTAADALAELTKRHPRAFDGSDPLVGEGLRPENARDWVLAVVVASALPVLSGGGFSPSSPKSEDTQPGSADSTAHLLAAFGQHRNLELSYDYRDDEPGWCVHRVNGGVNDREWALVAKADTPAEAIRLALPAAPEAGK